MPDRAAEAGAGRGEGLLAPWSLETLLWLLRWQGSPVVRSLALCALAHCMQHSLEAVLHNVSLVGTVMPCSAIANHCDLGASLLPVPQLSAAGGGLLALNAVCQPAPQLVRNLVCVSSIVSHVGASPQSTVRAHVANHAVVQWLLGLWELATSLVSWVPPVPASFGTTLTLPLTGGSRRQGCGSAAPFVGSRAVGWCCRTVRRRRASTRACRGSYQARI